jgi:cellulose synthase/poly-beta-1,6-N-acetylglucosamine synthase-like glycosyltransferase
MFLEQNKELKELIVHQYLFTLLSYPFYPFFLLAFFSLSFSLSPLSLFIWLLIFCERFWKVTTLFQPVKSASRACAGTPHKELGTPIVVQQYRVPYREGFFFILHLPFFSLSRGSFQVKGTLQNEYHEAFNVVSKVKPLSLSFPPPPPPPFFFCSKEYLLCS